MLGKLAKWLRLLGQDTLYETGIKDAELLRLCLEDRGRILLTRDTALLARRPVTRKDVEAVFIESDHAEAQLRQVIRATRIVPAHPRCPVDNAIPYALAKEEVQPEVPPYVFDTQDSFERCPRCRRLYWRATHWQRIEEMRASLFSGT